MLTYVYACGDCNAEFEVKQSIKDAPASRCILCGSERVRRLVSGGAGFILDGDGWFKDGYTRKPGSGT